MSQYAPCNRPLLREQLKAYADRQLPYVLRQKIRRHLGQCASCREELTDMENISRQLHSDGDAQNVPLAADLRARILAGVPVGTPSKADRKRHPLTPVRRPLYIWGAGATALIAWFALYPTLSRYNHSAAVLSNAKQIGSANMMYTQDYDESQKTDKGGYKYAPSGQQVEAASSPAPGIPPIVATRGASPQTEASAPSLQSHRKEIVQNGDAGSVDYYQDAGVEPQKHKALRAQMLSESESTLHRPGGADRAKTPSRTTFTIDRAEDVEPVERTVHHEGDITVQVDKVEQISEQVAGIAQGTGGFVASTQLTTEENSSKSATLVLKVPVARFDSTLAAVSHLGEVKGKNISGEDLTEKLSDEQVQQNVLQDDANMIQAKIKDGQGRRAQNEEQLRQLRVKVAQTKARLVLLKKLGALSTITVNLNEKPLPTPPPATGLMAEVHDTMQDALHSLTQAAHMPILLLIWMIAYAPLWVMVYLGYRYMSRTRYRLR